MHRRHARTITHTRVVDHTELARLRTPRHDLLTETAGDAPDTFALATGPFHTYRRELHVEPVGTDGTVDTDHHGPPVHHRVTETFHYDLAAPLWRALFRFPVARRLRRRPVDGHTPWWAPPAPLDARASTVLALLCTVSMVCGYLGTVITQTITFAADEFHNDKGAQGNTLAAVRIGIFLSMAIVTAADRRGRRVFTAWGTIAACVLTALGALSIDLWTLGASQTLARGITTAVAILVTIIAAEELPAGARAYGLSVLTLVAGLGAGMAVWVLPVADIDVRAWRIVYLVPLLALPLMWHVVRDLPETRRFAVAATHTTGPPIARRRLALLAVSGFLILAFRTPASQLQNEFLRDERGFDAARITLFTVVTSTPVGVGVFLGGRLADRRGRRVVGAVAMVFGSAAVVISFLTHGWPMWVWQLVGIVIGAGTIPALGVYGPELFGTRTRGRANGFVSIAGVAGSTLGLVVASHLADHVGLGKALALLSIGPLLVAGLVLLAYPETAHLELEQINPADDAFAPARAAGDEPSRA